MFRTMQVISFRNTALFKRGVWLTVVTLLVFAALPAVLDGTFLQNPAPTVFSVCLLSGVFSYFIWKLQVHRLVDEVVDGEDHLQVRRGRIEAVISFSNVALADVSSHSGLHRVTVHLRDPSPFGMHIEFLPQASLWANPPAIRRLAGSLTERANQAGHMSR
jgi:hypothetical protein